MLRKMILFFSLIILWINCQAQVDPFTKDSINNQRIKKVIKNDTDSLDLYQAIINPPFREYLQENFKTKCSLFSSSMLQEFLNNKNNIQLIILDTRNSKEYNASHLKEAKRIGFEDFSIETIWTFRRESMIVLYCSSGERSSQIVKQLQVMGFCNVYVLYGGIISWVNQGYKVVDEQGNRTKKVYFKDKKLSKWILPGKGGKGSF